MLFENRGLLNRIKRLKKVRVNNNNNRKPSRGVNFFFGTSLQCSYEKDPCKNSPKQVAVARYVQPCLYCSLNRVDFALIVYITNVLLIRQFLRNLQRYICEEGVNNCTPHVRQREFLVSHFMRRLTCSTDIVPQHLVLIF